MVFVLIAGHFAKDITTGRNNNISRLIRRPQEQHPVSVRHERYRRRCDVYVSQVLCTVYVTIPCTRHGMTHRDRTAENSYSLYVACRSRPSYNSNIVLFKYWALDNCSAVRRRLPARSDPRGRLVRVYVSWSYEIGRSKIGNFVARRTGIWFITITRLFLNKTCGLVKWTEMGKGKFRNFQSQYRIAKLTNITFLIPVTR